MALGTGVTMFLFGLLGAEWCGSRVSLTPIITYKRVSLTPVGLVFHLMGLVFHVTHHRPPSTSIHRSTAMRRLRCKAPRTKGFESTLHPDEEVVQSSI